MLNLRNILQHGVDLAVKTVIIQPTQNIFVLQC